MLRGLESVEVYKTRWDKVPSNLACPQSRRCSEQEARPVPLNLYPPTIPSTAVTGKKINSVPAETRTSSEVWNYQNCYMASNTDCQFSVASLFCHTFLEALTLAVYF